MARLFRLEITAPESQYEYLTGWFSIEAPYGWEEESACTGETIFRFHAEKAEILDNLRAKTERMCPGLGYARGNVENADWRQAWREFFTPVEAGTRFVVLPPWLATRDYGQRLRIIIDPKSAFGTGHHASTVLCLRGLSQLLDEGLLHAGNDFLDLGCGSGVLGIGAAKNGLTGLCLDVDELAIDNTRENLALNGCRNVEARQGSVEGVAGRHFDLVMANILARPLREMAVAICAALRPGGSLILSGILDIQADAVEKAYCEAGLPAAARLADGEWRALIWAGAC